jgi:O-antigen chain-terminating methyltransferase
MTMPFEVLAAEIREKAQRLRAENPDPHAYLEHEWQRLRIDALVPFTAAQSSARGYLLRFSGNELMSAIYRLVLKREADAEGLRQYASLIAAGAHPYLVAGIIGTSKEARSIGAAIAEFRSYRGLAYLLKFERFLPPIRQIVFLFARMLASRTEDADRNRFWFGVLQSTQTTMTSWHAVLTRQNEILAGLQQRVLRAEKNLDQARQQVAASVAKLSVRALSDTAQIESVDPKLNSGASSHTTAGSEPLIDPKLSAELNQYYLAFEDSHRGNAEQMRARYLPYITELEQLKKSVLDSKKPLLDLGCGRGEWLSFVAEQGITAQGVDSNPVMVKQAADKGLAVTQSDLISALKTQSDASLAAVTAFHVIEHLPFAVLFECVAQSWRALAPGGLLIFETPNPENLLVASHTFYHDHTHRNPLTPSSMQFLLHYWGFQRVAIKRLNPYPEQARVPGEDLLTERFNGHFCGPQDFAVVGIK